MQSLSTKIVAILAAYTSRSTAEVQGSSSFADLGIDRLDLPMIVVDIEDSLDIHVRFDDEVEAVSSVGQLVACVEARVEAQAAWVRHRAATPRVKQSWISTTAGT